MKLENCKNIEELVNEVYNQLLNQEFYTENYTLTESVKDYLSEYVNDCEIEEIEEWEDLQEEDIKEQITIFFEYDYEGTLLND